MPPIYCCTESVPSKKDTETFETLEKFRYLNREDIEVTLNKTAGGMEVSKKEVFYKANDLFYPGILEQILFCVLLYCTDNNKFKIVHLSLSSGNMLSEDEWKRKCFSLTRLIVNNLY